MDISVDFNATVQLVNTYIAFVKYIKKKRKYNVADLQLFTDFKIGYDSSKMEVL